MSETLTLAERLKQRQQQENETIQNLTREQLIALRDGLNTILSTELNTMQADMQRQIEAMSSEFSRRKKDLLWCLIRSRILFPALTALTVLGVILLSGWGLSAWQESQISQNWQTLRQQKQALDTMAEKGGKIQWSTCANAGEKGRLCLKIDERPGSFGVNGENYKIPLGY